VPPVVYFTKTKPRKASKSLQWILSWASSIHSTS
jgi:hypothetical protein